MSGREPGEKQKGKKSSLAERLIMLTGREPGENKKRKKSTLADWLPIPGINCRHWQLSVKGANAYHLAPFHQHDL